MVVAIPGPQQLGSRPSARSGRVIATQDTTAVGSGIAALGQGIGQLASVVQKIREDDDEVAVTKALSDFNVAAIDQDKRFRNGEAGQDYATWGTKSDAELRKTRDALAGSIRDPVRRQKFIARTDVQIADQSAKLGLQADGYARGKRREELNTSLSQQGTVIAAAHARNDAPMIERATNEGIASILAAGRRGDLSPAEVEKATRDFREQAAQGRVSLDLSVDPGGTLKKLQGVGSGGERASQALAFFMSKGWSKEQASGIVGNLIGESRLDPDAKGDKGTAFGIAQWRGERLNRLKRFAASKGKQWTDYETQLDFVDTELRVHERAAFHALQNAKTIDEATAAFVNFERPRGWTEGNPRGAHNFAGRLKFAQQVAAGEAPAGEAPAYYRDLSSAAYVRALNQAKATAQNELQEQGAARVASILSFGPESPSVPAMPPREAFIEAHGPEDGATRYDQLVRDVDVATRRHEFRTQTPAEIQASVDALKPVEGVTPARQVAAQAAAYANAQAAAVAEMKARLADPVQYAINASPEVAQAWEAVEGGDANAYSKALSLTAAFEDRIGIPPTAQRLLPDSVAKSAATAFNNPTATQEARLGPLVQAMFATEDRRQQTAIWEQMIKAGVPEYAQGALDALRRGDEGAARRLFEAVFVDPAALPGKIDKKPSQIAQAIQDIIMADGKIGDVIYGLGVGVPENAVRAQRDQKLIWRAVQHRLLKGETNEYTTAQAVADDLFGKKTVVNESLSDRGSVQAVIPPDVDEDTFLAGAEASLPVFEKAIRAGVKPIIDAAPTADSSRAILDAAAETKIENILAEGVIRNIGDGFGFMDPYTGQFVKGRDGKPVVLTLDEIIAKSGKPREGVSFFRSLIAPTEITPLDAETLKSLPPPVGIPSLPEGPQ